MAFEWRMFLTLAEEWQESAPSSSLAEALLRNSLSRAYFAAFCHARVYAIRFLGFRSGIAGDDHGRLRAYLKTKRRAEDGRRLDRLRQWRNEADYEDELSFDLVETTPVALQLALRVYSSLAPPSR
jgi:hypothetical protein